MAIGFSPKYIETIEIEDLIQEQFLVLLIEAAGQMNWDISYVSKSGFIAYSNNGMFSWNAEVKINIENNLIHIQSTSTGGELIDFGKNKKNVSAYIAKLKALKSTVTEEELNNKYQELQKSIDSQEEDLLTLPPPTTSQQIQNFFSIFKPTRDFFITPILLDLNILIFIIMAISGVNIISPDNDSLLNWGANFRPLTLDGEWWRLISSCFLHIGVFHLLMNMYALLYIGVLLEPLLGKTKFAIAYLLTGITSSITSLWWHDLTISAGASGAIFGLYGLFLALLTTNLIEKSARKSLLSSIAVFVGYNLIFGLSGGIDNAAHIGGLIGGLIIGYSFIPSLKLPHNTKLKYGTIVVITAFITLISTLVYYNTTNDIGNYDAKMQDFIKMETKALDVYNLPKNTPNEVLLLRIKDTGIYYWNENIKLIYSFNELNLPNEIVERNQKLKEYCDLRVKSYELLYKAISENTNQYDSLIENFNAQIDTKIKEIQNEQQLE